MRRAVLAFLFLLVTPALFAATFDRLSEARIVDRADLVVVATVESAHSRATGRTIVTDYTLRVERVLRGSGPADIVTVTELGGSTDDLIMAVSGAPSYEPGSRVMAFLRARGDGTYFTAYMANGALRFVRDRVVRTTDEGEAAYDAEQFIDFVRGNTAVAPKPVAPTKFEPRTEAAASAYVVSGGSPRKPVRWPGCNAGCNINFVLNGAQDVPNPAGGVENALAAWTNDPTSFVNMQLTGLTSITEIAQDGFNTILLNNASAAPLAICDGGIACGIAWATTTPHTFDGETFYSAFEADVIYRPGSASQAFFEAILAHELGHGLALRHSNEAGATPFTTNALMASSVPTSQGATLRDYDIEAMAEVYGNGVACAAPVITGTAGGGTVQFGNAVTLSVTATGTNPKTYQWYEGEKDDTGTPVGTNQATFRTPNITVERRYWVKVTNECGLAGSNTIVVTPTECNQPQITTQPQSQRIQPGQTATMNATATGTTPLTFAWYEGLVGDTSKKVGTNSTSFKTPALTQTTNYWLKVSNACGFDNSIQVTITVGNQCVAPTISQQPLSAEVSVGSKALLHVSAAGDAPIAFQWYEGEKDDTTKPIDGATSAVFEPGPFTTAGTFKYWAKASNACGSANSNAAVITAVCVIPQIPTIFAPPVTPRALDYEISWTGSTLVTPTFELQESTNPGFGNPQTFVVSGLKFKMPAHSTLTSDTRFYYRVRAKSACDNSFTQYSNVADTLVTVPLPQTSTEFVVGVPEGSTQPFKQDYLVPGFGATATNNDTFSITIDVPWMTVFPPSGALSAGGTTVQLTINPTGLPVGSNTATIVVTRVNGTAGRITTQGTTSANVPFSISLVTPVTPAPRNTTPPPGTLLIPAIAHADGIGTRFQSDIRIANASSEAITYEISFTPSASNGLATGKKTTLVIPAQQTTGLDDVVKVWFGSGTPDTALLGTLEIRPLQLAGGGVPSLFQTFASSRTYAISSAGTLGQFIPALPLSSFVGSIAQDPLARLSLQQIANNGRYRTNLGFTEGSGAGASMLVKLFDTGGNLLKSVPLSLTSYEHRQMNFGAVFGNDVSIGDGRIEVEVTAGSGGKVTAYASVLDNDTTDPLLVFPVQAAKLSSTRYVVPGVAELNTASNFHTDMRIYNPSTGPVVVSMTYKPQRGDGTPIPAAVTRTIDGGDVLAIDSVLPSLWNLNATGGAVTVTTSNAAPLVITARTFSREPDGGTYGQFIPAVTAADAVGLGERAIEVLQLEDSANFRSNVGLVEVTGSPVTVELTMRTPDALETAVVHFDLAGGEFMQIGRIFRSAGYDNVYNGRVSMKVIAGTGRVAGYGSVVDNRTADPTYVPSQ